MGHGLESLQPKLQRHQTPPPLPDTACPLLWQRNWVTSIPPSHARPCSTGKKDGSSAKASSTGSTGKDSERRRLQAELAAAQATLKVQEAAVRTLQSELEELRQQHAQEASTAADVLARCWGQVGMWTGACEA